MNKRFGRSEVRSDRVTVWFDGRDQDQATALECLMSPNDIVVTARIVLASAKRMKPAEMLRWISKYNGNNVKNPAWVQHSFGAGIRVISFHSNYWAFPQRDELGCVYGIKIWFEPLPE